MPPHSDLLSKPFELGRLLDRIGRRLQLDWIGDLPQASPVAPSTPSQAAMPSPADLEELLRLARIGYVRGLEAKLGSLAERPEHLAFVTALRGHVQDFDFTSLVRVLEGSLASEPESLDG